jgi:hypothetical protein
MYTAITAYAVIDAYIECIHFLLHTYVWMYAEGNEYIRMYTEGTVYIRWMQQLLHTLMYAVIAVYMYTVEFAVRAQISIIHFLLNPSKPRFSMLNMHLREKIFDTKVAQNKILHPTIQTF